VNELPRTEQQKEPTLSKRLALFVQIREIPGETLERLYSGCVMLVYLLQHHGVTPQIIFTI
jgi:hypothetical protein